jgi:hypothetical protein
MTEGMTRLVDQDEFATAWASCAGPCRLPGTVRDLQRVIDATGRCSRWTGEPGAGARRRLVTLGGVVTTAPGCSRTPSVTLRRDPAWPCMLKRRPLRSSTWTPPGAVSARADPDLRLAITQTSVVTNQAHPEIAGKDRDLPAARMVHADSSDGWAERVLDRLGEGVPRRDARVVPGTQARGPRHHPGR